MCATCARPRAAPPACKGAAVAASEMLRRLLRALAGLLGGVLAAGGARALTWADGGAAAVVRGYKGGGLTASGPALLVRKSRADAVALSGSSYVDSVSSASSDVGTTASPYKEKRTE